MVGSAVPQRESAAAYSRPVRVFFYQDQRSKEGWRVLRRTHLGKGARGRVHGASKRGQGEEGALEDEVDERIERLFVVRSHVVVVSGRRRKMNEERKKERYVRAR